MHFLQTICIADVKGTLVPHTAQRLAAREMLLRFVMVTSTVHAIDVGIKKMVGYPEGLAI